MTPEVAELREHLAQASRDAARLRGEAQVAADELVRDPTTIAKMRRDARSSELEVAELKVAQLQERLAAWERLAPDRARLLEEAGLDQAEIDAAWGEMRTGLEMIEAGHAKLRALKGRRARLNGQLRAAGHGGGLQLNLPMDRDWRRRAERLVRDYDRLVHPLM